MESPGLAQRGKNTTVEVCLKHQLHGRVTSNETCADFTHDASYAPAVENYLEPEPVRTARPDKIK